MTLGKAALMMAVLSLSSPSLVWARSHKTSRAAHASRKHPAHQAKRSTKNQQAKLDANTGDPLAGLPGF